LEGNCVSREFEQKLSIDLFDPYLYIQIQEAFDYHRRLI
jgi:hypothetical protein